MRRRRILIALWILCSALFVAFIATRNVETIKQEFERASLQQRVDLERTKEKAAPLDRLLGLTALALGVPIGLFGLGAFLLEARRRAGTAQAD